MKILFAAPENAWGGFLGMIRSKMPQHQFTASGRFDVDTLDGFDVLIPTMCPVSSTMLNQPHSLRLIQQCGSGLEGVDIAAARERNIWVANVPTAISGNADAVAELGVYMMIGLSRNVTAMAASLSNSKMGEPQGLSLAGKTAGIIGLGGIGQALADRLKSFKMNIIAIKRRNPKAAQKRLGLEWVGDGNDLEQLLDRSDYVILCLPLSAESANLINARSIKAMRPHAFLINLSRGGLIERQALQDALASKAIAGAGMDVFWVEPPDPKDPIFSFNVLATPHIAGSTDVSMTGIVAAVAENIHRLDQGKAPLNHYND
jgi:phosphoglycerate dehydrogenase-like enzyme